MEQRLYKMNLNGYIHEVGSSDFLAHAGNSGTLASVYTAIRQLLNGGVVKLQESDGIFAYSTDAAKLERRRNLTARNA
jgi:hypothetical protein